MGPSTTSVSRTASDPPSWAEPPATVEELLSRAKALRPRIASRGAEYDAEGEDPAEIMAALSASGVQAINVPAEYGGLLTHPAWGGTAPFIEAWHDIAAGDGSVGEMWGTNAFLARALLREQGLPQQTRAELAREILHQGRRLAMLQSACGTAGPTLARCVSGGIVVDGTKAFGTNTAGGGRDLANVVLGPTDDDDPTRITPHAALVRLDTPGVEPTGEWDNMGQRATNSQMIHFRDTFVSDGWHYGMAQPHPAYHVTGMLGNATLLQGIGAGAVAADVDYLRGMDRASMPMFESAATDPAMHLRIGEMAAGLAAAREFTLATARRVDADPETIDFADLMVVAVQTDIVATRTTLNVTSDPFELTGARSTAASHRLDRFWRNARTSGSHHPRDSTSAYVGFVALNQSYPPVTTIPDSAAHPAHQGRVVDRVEARLDIPLHQPLRSASKIGSSTSFRGRLDHPVRHGGNPQPTALGRSRLGDHPFPGDEVHADSLFLSCRLLVAESSTARYVMFAQFARGIWEYTAPIILRFDAILLHGIQASLHSALNSTFGDST